MQHVEGQQKALATRGRRSSRNQPDEGAIVRVGTTDSQDLLPPAIQALVYYPDHRGGFSRIGRVIATHAVTRGKRMGRVVVTIETALKQRVMRDGGEVELVK